MGRVFAESHVIVWPRRPTFIYIRMRQPTIFETIAMRLLDRQGIGVIWQLHLRASASHLDGNWLAAAALIGTADAAERQWAGRSSPCV